MTRGNRLGARDGTPSLGDAVLAEAVRRLADVYRPERIYVFGSVARGDAGPNSDYDLMILVPDSAPREMQSEDAGYVALRGSGAAVDIQVWKLADFERQLHLKASFPSTVAREGRLLYAA